MSYKHPDAKFWRVLIINCLVVAICVLMAISIPIIVNSQQPLPNADTTQTDTTQSQKTAQQTTNKNKQPPANDAKNSATETTSNSEQTSDQTPPQNLEQTPEQDPEQDAASTPTTILTMRSVYVGDRYRNLTDNYFIWEIVIVDDADNIVVTWDQIYQNATAITTNDSNLIVTSKGLCHTQPRLLNPQKMTQTTAQITYDQYQCEIDYCAI